MLLYLNVGVSEDNWVLVTFLGHFSHTKQNTQFILEQFVVGK